MEQFITALAKGTEYDYIADNYHNMSTYTLKSILLEYIYAAHQLTEDQRRDFEEGIMSELGGSLN